MADHDITLTVDGSTEETTVESRTLLVHALRDLDYTAPKVGCESGKCGTCTVHVDGDAVKSCTMLAVQADGRQITTAAGLADAAPGDRDLHPIQRAFHEEHGLQCGYCTPGMVMTTADLLDGMEATPGDSGASNDGVEAATDETSATPDGDSLDEAAIREGLKGNVCRCTGYHNVVRAVERLVDDGVAVETDGGSTVEQGGSDADPGGVD
jgi:carbon-monoxide dehydrogenase small subunit